MGYVNYVLYIIAFKVDHILYLSVIMVARNITLIFWNTEMLNEMNV